MPVENFVNFKNTLLFSLAIFLWAPLLETCNTTTSLCLFRRASTTGAIDREARCLSVKVYGVRIHFASRRDSNIFRSLHSHCCEPWSYMPACRLRRCQATSRSLRKHGHRLRYRRQIRRAENSRRSSVKKPRILLKLADKT